MGHRVGVEEQRAQNEIPQAQNPPYPLNRSPYYTPAVRTLSPHSATLAPVTECLPQMADSAPCHPVDHWAWTQLYPLGLLCLLWTPLYHP
jgi:hypothetical protein